MVNKDITKYREFRIDGRNFTKLRTKGGTKALKCGGGVELGDFSANLSGDELAFQVCRTTTELANRKR